MQQFRFNSKKQQHARGMTLPMLALFIVVLFLMAALAVDLGILYTGRTSAQHVADAAALAGARTFVSDTSLATDAEKIANAQNAAIVTAQQNKILSNAVTLTAANVNVDLTNQRVMVTVPETNTASAVTLYFSRIAGWTSSNVMAKATAEAGPPAGSSNCLKPIFLPNTVLSSLSPTDACKGPNPQVIFDPNNLNQYSSWFTTYKQTLYAQYQPLSIPPTAIRPTDPNGALTASQFYSIDFGQLLGSNSGAATYKCTLGKCLTDCTSNTLSPNAICGQSFPLETGNMVGPTTQGINDLIGPSPDAFGGIDNTGQLFYIHDGSDVYSSQSVALVPVWNDCPNTVSPGFHGQSVTIVGFASMFFVGMNSGNVQAYFLGANLCNAGQPGGGTAGAQYLPVRLIQNP